SELLLRTRLGEVEAGVVVETYPQRDRSLTGLEWGGSGERVPVVQPAGAGEMGDQVEPALDLQVKELAVPARAGELPPRERADRRIVCLERADRGDLHALDPVTHGALPQELGER